MTPPYREKIKHLIGWCSGNNLLLNTSKIKEAIVDFRSFRRIDHTPVYIHRKRYSGWKTGHPHYIWLHLGPPTWWRQPNKVSSSSGRWKGLESPPQLLTNFYRARIQSIFCLGIVWTDRKDLAWVVKNTHGTVGRHLPHLDSIYDSQVQTRACRLAADPSHPLPSERGTGISAPTQTDLNTASSPELWNPSPHLLTHTPTQREL